MTCGGLISRSRCAHDGALYDQRGQAWWQWADHHEPKAAPNWGNSTLSHDTYDGRCRLSANPQRSHTPQDDRVIGLRRGRYHRQMQGNHQRSRLPTPAPPGRIIPLTPNRPFHVDNLVPDGA